MNIAAKKLNIIAIAIAAILLAPSAFATVPRSGPSTSNWCKPKELSDCEARYKKNWERVCSWRKKCGTGNNNQAKRELEAALRDLRADAAQLQFLVVKSFFGILTGKIKVNDPKYLALANSYVAQVNEINSEIARINQLIAAGNFSGAAQRLDNITNRLAGIVAAGNLLFAPGVSLNA